MVRGPAEVFGFTVTAQSAKAREAQKRYWCPFMNTLCEKKSRLLEYPMGICSMEHGDDVIAICPRRFRQDNTVFQDIAVKHFGDTNNIMVFSEVGVPRLGSFDFVMVRHAPLSDSIEDFAVIEFQTDSTTSTGHLVRALEDFMTGDFGKSAPYNFGRNTYDTLKRAFTQVLNKGVVMEAWGHKIYWVVLEYLFANLTERYGFGDMPFHQEHTTVFATYKLELTPDNEKYALHNQKFASSSVDNLLSAFRSNPDLPSKEEFVHVLQRKVKAGLSLKFKFGSEPKPDGVSLSTSG